MPVAPPDTDMVRRRYRMNADVDTAGLIASFAFGLLVGVGVAYPALPSGLPFWDPSSIRIESSPVAGALLVGVALFAFFVLGVFVLNWMFMETAE